MGNNKAQTLQNRFRLEELQFNQTQNTLRQKLEETQPHAVLKTIVENLSERIKALNLITNEMAAVLNADLLDNYFHKFADLSRQYEEMEITVSIVEHEQPRAARTEPVYTQITPTTIKFARNSITLLRLIHPQVSNVSTHTPPIIAINQQFEHQSSSAYHCHGFPQHTSHLPLSAATF